MNRNKVLMIFFIASEGMFFSMLISAYILFNSAHVDGPTAASSLKFGRTLIFTISLLSSSVTMFFAEKALHKGNREGFLRWMTFTIVLGAIFLLGQAYEYTELFTEGTTLGRNIFGSTFFTLTGFHGLHVFMGLVALVIYLVLGAKGELDKPAGSSTSRRRAGTGTSSMSSGSSSSASSTSRTCFFSPILALTATGALP